jgi:hypothetical protein
MAFLGDKTMNEQMKATVTALETKRAGVVKKSKIMMAIGIPLIVVFAVLAIVALINEWLDGIAFIIFLILLVAAIIVTSIGGGMRSSFKKEVIRNLREQVRKDLFPQARVLPREGLQEAVLLKPGFFNRPDRYLYKDYMSAVYNDIPFEQAHYDLQKEQTTNDGHGHTTTTYVSYAVGTMYHFTYGRDFGAIVKVMEKQGIISFGHANLKKVETEYIQFNKKFQVLTNDETTVFFILTPQIQEKIMSLESKFKGRFFMAFMGKELFIAVDDSDQSLDFSIKKPLNEENVGPLIECLAIPAVFISLLGLSTNKYKKDAGVVR